MVDLEWNRKTIFEKLDWLKETLEDVITKANHNVDVQQKQILAITARLSALEKPAQKATKTAKLKKAARPPARRIKPVSAMKRKR